MDTDKLIQHGRARFAHASARRLLKEKYQARLLFAYRGGMWQSGPTLHCTITSCGRTGEVVIVDLYENPIRIDTNELLRLSQQRWHEQMNAWLVEHDAVNQQR